MKEFHKWLEDMSNELVKKNNEETQPITTDVPSLKIQPNCLVCNKEISLSQCSSLVYCSYKCYSESAVGKKYTPTPWGVPICNIDNDIDLENTEDKNKDWDDDDFEDTNDDDDKLCLSCNKRLSPTEAMFCDGDCYIVFVFV